MESAQRRYDNSLKGKDRTLRENERRRNKTKFKRVMEQLVRVSELMRCLKVGKTTIFLKYGKKLHFLE